MTLLPMHSTNVGVEEIDDQSVVIYLDCPGTDVVLLQAYFDLYEGLGIVRTLDIRRSLVCILTTPDMLKDCIAALASIQDKIPWRYAPYPSQDTKNLYLGYGKKGL